MSFSLSRFRDVRCSDGGRKARAVPAGANAAEMEDKRRPVIELRGRTSW